jgi:hypothetical protein
VETRHVLAVAAKFPELVVFNDTAPTESYAERYTLARHDALPICIRVEPMLDQAGALGPVSGFVLSAPGEPTLYVAGDTVCCDAVAQAIAAHSPECIVVNAGGARFVRGGTITMEAADVIATAGAAPSARVVAVHMEAINHCLETRAELAERVDAAGLSDRVVIPGDGDAIEM